VRSVPWRRAERIAETRQRIWLYLTPAAGLEQDAALQAAALLQLTEADVLALARVHFLLTPEVQTLLDGLPFLLRQLATTTAREEEQSAERVRGAIVWGSTIAARTATGLPHLYVTAPARRAYQTPENELLVFVLDAIAQLGQQTSWHGNDGTGIGRLVSERTAVAHRWLQSRMLLEVERRPPTARSMARVRAGRHRRRYQHAISVWERYRSLVAQLDRAVLRELIESTAIVTRHDAVLFELLCLFAIIDALRECGWHPGPLRLFGGRLWLAAQRGDERIELWYQQTPVMLAASSRYTEVLRRHGFARPTGLRPDIILRRVTGASERWLLVEVKLRRNVDDAARAALQDLLAYRRAFDASLTGSEGVYGLGVAWGADLEPAPAEVMLCTPNTIGAAIRSFTGETSVGAADA
jgi:hypothetical protein